MTKRTAGKFERAARDFYATPPAAIHKLLKHIQDMERFAEPMCGDGAIVKTLEELGWECAAAWDLEPQGEMVGRAGTYDVNLLQPEDFEGCEGIISNPPWPWPSSLRKGKPEGYPAVGIIEHLMKILPTWMILSADFMHNRYFEPLSKHCPKIVSVGRVKWMAGTKNTGFDNAAWYKFDASVEVEGPILIPNREPEVIYHPSIEGLL